MLIVILPRKNSEIFKKVNKFAHLTNIIWLPLFFEQNTMCLGPMVIPGETPCWECSEYRFDQEIKQGGVNLHTAFNTTALYPVTWIECAINIVLQEIELYNLNLHNHIIGKRFVFDFVMSTGRYYRSYFRPDCQICSKL